MQPSSRKHGLVQSSLRGAAPLWATALLLAITCTPRVAPAQERERAQRRFEEAQRQFDAANYVLALEGFTEAQRLMEGDSRAEVLIEFNIGRCHEELDALDEAVASFERYLTEAPAEAPFLAETRDRVRELRARIARRPPPEVPPPSPALAIAGWTTLGLGAAAVIASVPLGVVALDHSNALERECPGGRCPTAEQGRLDDARTLSIASDVLWIAGAGVAAVGARARAHRPARR